MLKRSSSYIRKTLWLEYEDIYFYSTMLNYKQYFLIYNIFDK